MYCLTSDIIPVVKKEKIKTLLGLDDGGNIDNTVIDPYCDWSSNDIDTALSGVYVIPITGTQSLRVVRGIAIALTIEKLYKANSDMKIPDHIKDDADRARAQLDAYSGIGLVKPIKYLTDAPLSNWLPETVAPDEELDFTQIDN